MKKAGVVFLLMIFLSALIHSYDPPTGTGEWYRFYSPRLLAGGDASVSTLSPGADSVNPAASGGQQRLTLDLNSILLQESGGPMGVALNLGASLPTRAGVATGSVHYLHAPFAPALGFGDVFSLNLSFAKDLYPDLYVGAGLKLMVGNRSRVDWGLGLDLGFLYFAGDAGSFRDLTVGGAIRNIGKGYNPVGTDGSSSFPAVFNPVIGTGFTILKNSVFGIRLTGDLSFPAFQDVRLQAGSGITYKDFITLDTSLSYSLDDIRSGSGRLPVPSLGLTIDLNRNRPGSDGTATESWKDSEIGIETAATPLYGKTWAYGAGVNIPIGVLDKRAPIITIGYPNVSYISANHDGKSDVLDIPMAVSDERFVKGYRFIVENDKGEVVREIRNKEERPENRSIGSLMDRILYLKKGISIPDRLRWEGTGNNGAVVPDGRYSFYVEAWDDNGNTGRTNAYTVFMDTESPKLELTVPEDPVDLIFSPNGDGNKDSLAIVQSGSTEDLWEGKILDANGAPVKTFQWKSAPPSSFPWDGKNMEGILSPDSVYSYVITSTDRAENTVEKRIDNIIINTMQPPIRLNISSANFSPDSNGIQDDISINPDVPVQTGIGNWSLVIRDEAGATVRSLKAETMSSSRIPGTLVFDGKYDNGTYLPEGRYMAVLGVLYQNGHNPTSESPYFTLDTTPPGVRVRTDYRVFSPNGDGKKETVTIFQETTNEDAWTGTITDSAGKVIQEAVWTGKADATFLWDGRGTDRKILPDGTYYYTVSSVDRAGNAGASERLPIVIDARETPVALSSQDEAFSPNSDGLKDRLDLLPQLKIPDGVELWELVIFNESGTAVRTQRAPRRDGIQFTWDGLSDAGSRSPDGRYMASLKLRYLNGNEPTAQTGYFLLDTVPPRAEAKTNYTVFSPNSDGNKDEISISQETTREARWTGTIQNADNRVVKSYSWLGEAEKSISWDGRGDDKLVQPDGKYSYRITAIDLAGNKGMTDPLVFEVNTEETPLFVSSEYDAFSPNSDGAKDTIRFITQLKVTEGLQTYTLSISNREGRTVKKYSGNAAADLSLKWDGSTDDGRKAPDDSYTAQLSVLYVNGNAPEAKTSAFRLDTTPPGASVRADYAIFSPNGDGNKDIITFSQETSKEDTWTGTILNAAGKPVKVFTWSGNAEQKLFWDGRGNDKSIVPDGMYRYQLAALDEAGNRGSSTDTPFELTTADTPLFISSGSSSFSPNRDGENDTIQLLPQVRVEKGMEKYEIRIASETKETVRVFTGTSRVPQSVAWDGLDTSGKVLKDGRYLVDFSAVYTSGNAPKSDPMPIVLDTIAPEVRVAPELLLFSPNGDGHKDSVVIRQSSSTEDLWEGRIVSDKGEAVRSYTWKGKALDLIWDGLDQNGNRVKDGVYHYTVTSTDSSGNRTERRSDPLVIDTRNTSVFVTAGKTGFSPNGDGVLDDIAFSTLVNIRDGIESWNLALTDETGSVQRKFSGTSLPPASILWDGKNDAGMVKEGTYTAQLTVVYQKGDRPAAVTREFSLDVSAPVPTVTLKPALFSPDNDGIDDEVAIGLKVKDRNLIESWTFEIIDPENHPFISYSGNGVPSETITWDGRSSTAELVQAAEDYPYIFTVKDSLGNVSRKTGVIPVDVLVIRDGDRLKIRISSITFPAYKADLVWTDAEASAKNLRILQRLAEILNKYSSYRVRVEGHAVSEYWSNAARAAREEQDELQPLSQKRAESVKAKLVEFGVDASRLSTLGRGGKEPVVPHGDVENRWKNRRVEFILIK